MTEDNEQVQPDWGGAVSLADEDGVRQILVDTMFGLWSVRRHRQTWLRRTT